MRSTSIPPDEWSLRLHTRLERGTIPGLDGIRALAVFLVIANHFGFERVNGAFGVLIFFVLSGFLITWLMLRESERSGTVSLKHFYTRRMLRICPAFYTFWISAVGIYLVRGHHLDWGPVISSFFYVSNYYMGLVPTAESVVGHTWSLSIEEQFYLLWPLLFLLGRKNLSRLARLLMAAIALVWVHRTLAHLVYGARPEYIYRAFDTRLDHLAVGCLLAVMLKQGALDRFAHAITQRSWYPAVTLALLFSAQVLHNSLTFTYVVGYAVEPLLVAVFLLQLIWYSETGVWRIFESPVTRYLGRISYPLYLWQGLTLFTAKRLTEGLPTLVQFTFAVAVTVAFASGSYFLVEKPFLRLKRRF
jgi:peptidoglycan/LPS O-acetylase OafA/YrhL